MLQVVQVLPLSNFNTIIYPIQSSQLQSFLTLMQKGIHNIYIYIHIACCFVTKWVSFLISLSFASIVKKKSFLIGCSHRISSHKPTSPSSAVSREAKDSRRNPTPMSTMSTNYCNFLRVTYTTHYLWKMAAFPLLTAVRIWLLSRQHDNISLANRDIAGFMVFSSPNRFFFVIFFFLPTICSLFFSPFPFINPGYAQILCILRFPKL